MSKEEIERLATELRMSVEEKHKNCLKPKYVADAIAKFLDLEIDWDDIPDDGKRKVAAMILPLEKQIILNEDIHELELTEEQKDGFIQSTIAHEIGHWMLHINHDAVGNIEGVNDGSKEIFEPSLSRGIVRNLDKIEWQAQYFAGCLLMPKYKLEEARKGRDLTNWKHLYAMADELGVTISNLIYRLQIDLKWIDIPKDSKKIYLDKAAPN
ncbi:ImmA/IrrE family metallo-endopeptidase [Okeania sp. SIO1I7]|uniref:ImmA/IrrE family metallo-endopeptidase n=1 Tax=Okeania sp. SIO1I7 TaxID=2607772 RepID=UPI0025ED6C32|nr:ImmA/IrrE family metallo-endopeptidase [Okeania sp. SIO1I7]